MMRNYLAESLRYSFIKASINTLHTMSQYINGSVTQAKRYHTHDLNMKSRVSKCVESVVDIVPC